MRLALITLIALGLSIPLVAQGDKTTARKGTVEQITVHGKSLEGNLEGDSADRTVFVYLPPGYATNPGKRYPVVYLLHGYGLTGERWMTFTKMADAADEDIANGTMRDMILVNPDAHTKYDGSMYSTSPTTGDWETFIAQDLVSYIDGHYRTIANRMSRGLGGHSMGGYGTVRIGMKRPDVFSSLYIMSACCLLNDPGAQRRPPANTAANTQNNANAANGQGRAGRNVFGNVQKAEAAAWSSDPNNPPDYLDLPLNQEGEVANRLARAKWIANSPLIMLDQYVTNLNKYHAIAGEVGTKDGLADSNRQLDQAMTTFRITHTFETYDGDHTNRVPERIEQKVLPFFSNELSFGSAAHSTARR
jgi:enterochelin esterase-like enzyme